MILDKYNDNFFYDIDVLNKTLCIEAADIQKLTPTEDLAKELNIPYFLLFLYDNCIELNGTKYFFKQPKSQEYLVTELLGEILSKYMLLPTVTHHIALLEGKVNGLISENFRKKNVKYIQSDFLSLEDLKLIRDTLTSPLYEHTPFKDELARYLMRNIYASPTDISGNVLCKKSLSSLRLAPLYDYENSLKDYTIKDYCDDDLFEKQTLTPEYIAKLISESPSMNKAYNRILNFNMEQALEILEQEKGIQIHFILKDQFINFDERRKKFMLKNIKKI